jgi:hypothetical protein
MLTGRVNIFSPEALLAAGADLLALLLLRR